jgi:hypothetical protein
MRIPTTNFIYIHKAGWDVTCPSKLCVHSAYRQAFISWDFKIFIAVTMKNTNFWDVTQHSLSEVYLLVHVYTASHSRTWYSSKLHLFCAIWALSVLPPQSSSFPI